MILAKRFVRSYSKLNCINPLKIKRSLLHINTFRHGYKNQSVNEYKAKVTVRFGIRKNTQRKASTM